MKRLLCLLFGHPDSAIVWGRWQADPESGVYRLVTEECDRCGAVLALSSMSWDEVYR